MKRVSFDFDDTLSTQKVQRFAKWCQFNNCEVWVVTARVSDKNLRKHGLPENWNTDLWEVMDYFDIPEERVVFTGYGNKHEFFWSEHNQDFIFHLDDDPEVKRLLNGFCPKLVAMNHFEDPKWVSKLTELIKNNE